MNNKCLVFSYHMFMRKKYIVYNMRARIENLTQNVSPQMDHKNYQSEKSIQQENICTHQFIVRFHSFLFTTLWNMSLVYCHTLIYKGHTSEHIAEQNKIYSNVTWWLLQRIFFQFKWIINLLIKLHVFIWSSYLKCYWTQYIWWIFKRNNKYLLFVWLTMNYQSHD